MKLYIINNHTCLLKITTLIKDIHKILIGNIINIFHTHTHQISLRKVRAWKFTYRPPWVSEGISLKMCIPLRKKYLGHTSRILWRHNRFRENQQNISDVLISPDTFKNVTKHAHLCRPIPYLHCCIRGCLFNLICCAEILGKIWSAFGQYNE